MVRKTQVAEKEKVVAMLPKILIVDDDEQIRKQIQWALSEEFRVYSAGDRRAAIELFNKEQTPVVLLDLGLPPHPREAIEGLQALEEMIGLNPLAKVIIVSGNSERHNALAASRVPAHKPGEGKHRGAYSGAARIV
jgi:two-component system NtrC family response regulator